MLRLLPLSQREVEGHPKAFLPWQKGSATGRKPELAFADLWHVFIRGFYPEIRAYPKTGLKHYLLERFDYRANQIRTETIPALKPLLFSSLTEHRHATIRTPKTARRR
jgi:hypothetical protein